MADDLTLVAGRAGAAKSRIGGWTSVRVTRGCERMPADFSIGYTERYDQPATVAVRPGDECEVWIGADRVVTGYVDAVLDRIDAGQHTINLAGRSKSADLVDCAAEWPGSQISGATVKEILTKLAGSYGITVRGSDAEAGPPIPQFNLIQGETPYSILERLLRFRALLAYDLQDGSVLLRGVSDERMASGFTLGVNVERVAYVARMDLRYSEYLALELAFDRLHVAGTMVPSPIAQDQGVPRHRRHVTIAEPVADGLLYAQKQAQWEAACRIARAAHLRLTTDSWRDSAGRLWEPNTLVPLSLPQLKIEGQLWTIGEVTYRRDQDGTHADLAIMPPDAFQPKPIQIQPALPGVK